MGKEWALFIPQDAIRSHHTPSELNHFYFVRRVVKRIRRDRKIHHLMPYSVVDWCIRTLAAMKCQSWIISFYSMRCECGNLTWSNRPSLDAIFRGGDWWNFLRNHCIVIHVLYSWIYFVADYCSVSVSHIKSIQKKRGKRGEEGGSGIDRQIDELKRTKKHNNSTACTFIHMKTEERGG